MAKNLHVGPHFEPEDDVLDNANVQPDEEEEMEALQPAKKTGAGRRQSTFHPRQRSRRHEPDPQTAHPQKHVWPLFEVGAGAALGYFWLWGNTVQLATSEAWFNHLSGVTLTPHFSIIMQVTDFWNGFDAQNTIAYTWAWGIQVLLLVFSIGVEWPVHTPAGKARARWFKYGTIICVVLNSLADFFFSSTYGFWEQLAFTGITLMMSCFFGLLGLHLMITGFKKMFRS